MNSSNLPLIAHADDGTLALRALRIALGTHHHCLRKHNALTVRIQS
jgi:hypothetical protein